jgi:hypothetical protein
LLAAQNILICMEHLYSNEGAQFDTVLQGVGSVVICNLHFLLCSTFIRFMASLGAMVSTPKQINTMNEFKANGHK